ncbi:Protein EARLY FLOWERING 3 [Apostasia shenzhenica]|uniref:Protein EARLY FLOWERING 3 n=1 Tax=Apostasia shenzhenica TaxID=1088818 RepID=A0A2I0AJF1_9ASPA|nr:Protein EARLY FLOWERING 3 [Apostasia shenzhenica]
MALEALYEDAFVLRCCLTVRIMLWTFGDNLVQKLFASSPHLLLDNPHVTKIQPKASSKSLPMPSSLKLQLHVVHQRDESPQMPTHMIADCLVDKATVLPLQTQERGQLPRYAPQAGNQPSFPMTHHDNSPSTWYFPPTASQWLIPVMSPSEGLVYKPYSGPCPPSAGFMAPFYGGCGHLTLPPITNDFMNAAYAVPALHTQQPNPGVLPASPAIGPNYFPAPYGMPVTNTLVSASAIEQSIPLNGTDPNKHVAQHSRNSCNMSITGSEALSDCAPKNYPSRGSEVQGSTASSPCDRTRGKGRDALPLFPTSPAAGCSGLPSQSSGREYQINVIKVVPHNARSATESAARIFKSIQEERKQLEW